MEKGAKEIAWTWSGKTVEIGVDRLGTGPTLLLLPALSSISTRKEMWPLQMLLTSLAELTGAFTTLLDGQARGRFVVDLSGA